MGGSRLFRRGAVPLILNEAMEPELAIVAAQVKQEIKKTTLARTQQTAAKKKSAKKKPAKKKPAKKKKAKKKKAGKGIFKVRTFSPALATITGKAKMATPAMVKAVWTYIKAKKLNSKRMITPDAALGKVIGGKMTMFKMTKALFKHVK